jgi:hypothetical protein
VPAFLRPVVSKDELQTFYDLEDFVYASYPQHRSNGGEMMHLLVEGQSVFCRHASIYPYLIIDKGQPAGRFAFIRDLQLPDYVQVSFFEAFPGIEGLAEEIVRTARELFPQCGHLLVGLDGHLNYGAGFLLNRFDEVPLFELRYTPPYYPEYFKALKERRMVTFRTGLDNFYIWKDRILQSADLKGITVRQMDLEQFSRDVRIYTELNNNCFQKHPYWSDRTAEEDEEQFRTMGQFLRAENLLFTEYEGEAVGYLLWFPDLNELIKPDETLGTEQLDKYNSGFRFETYRFYEIAVMPRFRGTATLALFANGLVPIQKLGCQFGEGGFIFEDNSESIVMTQRYFTRSNGYASEPYRLFAVYECDL